MPEQTGAAASASDYDEFVDWDKRLAREGPFFKELFEEHGVERVVDVGSGSARHAILFATWGRHVVAVDPDESMLAQARANVMRFADLIEKAGGSVELVQGGFGGVARLCPGPVDAVTCTGNALPHVAGRAGLTEALTDLAAVLRPGGVLVLHLLNHARLLSARPRAIAPKVVDTVRSTTKVFLRVIDYEEGDEHLLFDFVTLERGPDGEWALTNRRSRHTALPPEVLVPALREAGFTGIEVFGGHDRHAVRPEDESIVVVARRR